MIVPDRISDILAKGEYQPDYYNPGRVFDEVDILVTNDDRPDIEALRRTVGKAKLRVWNYPEDLTLPSKSYGALTPLRLRRWAKGGVALAKKIAPDMIRCHGADWNTFLASRIKAVLGIPYVVSLHINPDVNPVRRYCKVPLTPLEARHNRFYEYLERVGLRNADLVMPVYQPILPYLARLGVTKVEVCYNVLNGSHLRKKTDYRLHSPIRVAYVGRLIADKDPSNIIRSLPKLPDIQLTIIGDGPKRPHLEALVADLRLDERVVFEPTVINDELCQRLPEFDIFAIHSEYWEISKSVLEALLTGLPCIINRRIGEPVPELEGAFVRTVANTVEGYQEALSELIHNDELRTTFGRRAFTHAQVCWAPALAEAKIANIYRSMLRGRGGA